MSPIIAALGSLFSFRFRSRASLELEVIALRHQLTVLRRRRRQKKIELPRADRLLWALLYHIWPQIKDIMTLVTPGTVVRWHHQCFRCFWRWKSGGHPGGRPLGAEVREMIRQMARENPLWGIARVHGELLKLGLKVSETTVRRYMGRHKTPPSIGWLAFLRNQMNCTVAMDMFVVISLTFRLLYVVIFLHHDRRKIIHFAVSPRPTQDWLASQIIRAFLSNPKPRFLLRDRDPLYGRRFRDCLQALGICDHKTSPQSPWQNVYVERVIGSIRRECLDHIVITGERHLQAIMSSYVQYYNSSRTHKSLDKDCPNSRAIMLPSAGDKVVAYPEVGGAAPSL